MAETKSQENQFVMSRGMKFPKHADFIQGRIRRMLRTNTFGEKETEAALRTVKADDVIIEVGGGIGYLSTLVATKRAIKSVHTFEANPHLIPYIQQVHAANNVTNAEVTNAILGPRKGTTDFYVRRPVLGSSTEVLEGEVDPPSIKVDVMNASQVFKSIKPDVLICDIAGAEADLIPQLDLTGLRAAVIGTHPRWIGPEGINKVYRACMDAGLAYFHRGSHGKVICFRRSW